MRSRLLLWLLLSMLPGYPALAQKDSSKLSGQAKRQLKEVTVSARKPLVEHHIDRTIVNIEAMITAAGSNLLEALAKSPGVSVDLNDGISLNGRHNVLVLIDDKPTYLSAAALGAYLRSLPASLADRIELISNPPAKYDAAGGAIINIVLKKNRAMGLDGNINLGYTQWVYARTNDALNVNFKTQKVNLSGNLSYSGEHNYYDETNARYFYGPDGAPLRTVLLHNRYQSGYDSWNARMGMDYFVTPKTVVGAVFTGNINPKTDWLGYNSHQYSSDMRPDTIASGYTSGKYDWKKAGLNLNFLHKFDSTGQTITADVDYLHYYSGSSQISPNAVYLPDGKPVSDSLFNFEKPIQIHIYSGKADYTLPLAHQLKFEAGIKSSYVVTDNLFNWYNEAGSIKLPDYARSNHFRYIENINAAYISGKKEWTRWAVQGGLRIENTIAKSHQPGNPVFSDTSFRRSYNALFPSLYLSYKLDSGGHHMLFFRYSKRISRPNYQQLNPFVFYVNRYSYNAGNPNLTASYNQYIELMYTYKHYFSFTVDYGGGNNGLYTITRAYGDVFVSRPENFMDNRFLGLVADVSLSPARWWALHLHLLNVFFYNNGDLPGISIHRVTNLHEVEVYHQFKFGKGWSAELTGFFPGAQTWAQNRSSAVYNISAGVQRSLLKDKATIRLKADDIFNTMRPHGVTTGIDNAISFYSRQNDNRRVGVSFNYRFGKQTNSRSRNRRTGSADDESKRTD